MAKTEDNGEKKVKKEKAKLPPPPSKKDIAPLLDQYLSTEKKVEAARSALQAAREESSAIVEKVFELTGYRNVSFKGRSLGRPMKKGNTYFFMGNSVENLEF